MTIQTDDWYGLYGDRWGNLLTQEAMGHPAKCAFGLSARIYEHAFEEGWLHPGDRVIDPFGGIAGFCYHALLHELVWVGVELEQHHVDHGASCECTGITKEDWVRYQGRFDHIRFRDGRHICPRCIRLAKVIDPESKQLSMFDFPSPSYRRNSGKIPVVLPHHYVGNIELWRSKGVRSGQGVLLQGDSRKLREVLRHYQEEDAQMALSSPPFTGVSSDGGWQMLGKYAEKGKLTVKQVNGDPTKLYPSWSPDRDTSYGSAPGQLSGMPEGDPPDLALSSPPFIAQSGGTNVTAKDGPLADRRLLDRHSAGNSAAQGYGDAEQNLANLPEGSFDNIISSPPFADSLSRDRVDPETRRALARSQGESNAEHISPIDMENIGEISQQYGATPGNLGGMGDQGFAASIASPPYAEARIGQESGQEQCGHHDAYSKETAGQLGAMKAEGDYQLVLSSPPYADIAQSGGTEGLKKYGTGLTGGERCFTEYGEQAGQLGRMPDEGYASAISSPPFEAVTSDRPSASIVEGGLRMGASSMGDGYGESEGQLGAENGETFWTAARQILEELYMVLRPGGKAIFVVKAYVKDGSIVPFPEQWMMLCEAVGFIPLHFHRAWVVEDKGTQLTLEGEAITKQTSRKSFFRRLYEKNHPENAIDFECVICLEKPG